MDEVMTGMMVGGAVRRYVTIRSWRKQQGSVRPMLFMETGRVSPETTAAQEPDSDNGVCPGRTWECERPGGCLLVVLANPHKTYEEAIGADPFYGR